MLCSHVNTRPLIASLLGNLKRRRLVLLLTIPELSNCSDTTAGPIPNIRGGFPESADASLLRTVDKTARLTPPAAIALAIEMGRNLRIGREDIMAAVERGGLQVRKNRAVCEQEAINIISIVRSGVGLQRNLGTDGF